LKTKLFAALIVWALLAAFAAPVSAQINVPGMQRNDGKDISEQVRVRIVKVDAQWRETATVAEFGRCKDTDVTGLNCVSSWGGAFSVFTQADGTPLENCNYAVHVFDKDAYAWSYVQSGGAQSTLSLWSTEVSLRSVGWYFATFGGTRYLVVVPRISNPYGFRMTVRVRLKGPSWNAGEATLGTSYEYTLAQTKMGYSHYFLVPDHLAHVGDGVLHPEIEATFQGDTWMLISARETIRLR
jgi:hypothetical protein